MAITAPGSAPFSGERPVNHVRGGLPVRRITRSGYGEGGGELANGASQAAHAGKSSYVVLERVETRQIAADLRFRMAGERVCPCDRLDVRGEAGR